MKAKRDGTGKPIRPEAEYYIQDNRSIVGNCALWWCPEGAGYTCEIFDAGVFRGDSSDVNSDRHSDVPWPVEVVRAAICQHVRIDTLRERAPRRQR